MIEHCSQFVDEVNKNMLHLSPAKSTSASCRK